MANEAAAHREIMTGSALISACGRFRYELIREWDGSLPWCCFIGLNPSTADATLDDPTIRRCIGFSKSFGCGRLLMLNLYAFRTVSPKVLWDARKKGVDIIGGPANYFDAMQKKINERGALTIAAWGKHGKNRGTDALCHLRGLHYLTLNADRTPKHPLYLKASLTPSPFAAIRSIVLRAEDVREG